jgi:hypothetical protein
MTTIDMTYSYTQGVSQALIELIRNPVNILAFRPNAWEYSIKLKPMCLSELGRKLKCVNRVIRREVHQRELATTPEKHLECMYDHVYNNMTRWLRFHLMGETQTTDLSVFYEHNTHVSFSARDIDVAPTEDENRFELSLRFKHHGRGVIPDVSSIMTVPYTETAGILTLSRATIHEIVTSHADKLFTPLLNEHLVRAVLTKHRVAVTHEAKVFDDAKVAVSLAAIARMARQGPRLDSLERAAKRQKTSLLVW